MFPTASTENRLLGFSGIGHRAAFGSLVTRHIPNLSILSLDGFQWCPCWVFDEEGTNRRDNITDWALSLFRAHFAAVSPGVAAKARRISKDSIFHYVYAILHHPKYRETFAENLKRELPRIPLANSLDDFAAFVRAGERLAYLHLNYDDEAKVKPYPLTEQWTLLDAEGHKRPKSTRVENKMKLSKDKGSLRVNPVLTLEGIPEAAFRYRLGNRSALEWVIDQYKVHTDAKTGITSDANAWGEERGDPAYIVRLVKQVVTVSLETMEIVDSLPEDYGGPPRVAEGDELRPASPTEPAKGKGPKFQLKGEGPSRKKRQR